MAMTLYLSVVSCSWLLVAFLLLAHVALFPTVQAQPVNAQQQPGTSVMVASIQIGSFAISYGRKRDYFSSV